MPNRKQTNRVIFHHSLSTFGDVETIRKWHIERGFSDIGYHFVVVKDGKYQIARQIDKVGSHAMGRNIDSVGVCIVGDFRIEAPSEYQLSQCEEVYQRICNHYKKKLPVEFHHEQCPGQMLDREKFLERMNSVKITISEEVV